ncbi:MAG: ABC transporter substrate-binding protein, partial [Pseudomonadota bacterium]
MKPTRLLAGAALSLALALPAFAQNSLVIVSTQVPRHLNGAVQSGTATGVPSAQIFASPLRFDNEWNPQPYLAESWEVSEDGLTFTLNLRQDALFHDGEPVTSEDVAFTIETIKENHPFKTMFAPVETVETPDAHTAVLKL